MTTIKITSPESIVEAVPYLLGYHPEESLVLIGVSIDSRYNVAARCDLADVNEQLSDIIAAMQRGGTVTFVPIIFTTDRDSITTDTLATIIADIDEILDLLVVIGNRWFSMLCDNPDCCPEEGKEIDWAGPASTAFVVAGAAPTTNRDELVQRWSVDGDSDEFSAAVTSAIDKLRALEPEALVNRLTELGQSLLGHLRDSTPVPDELIPELAAAMVKLPCRDTVWLGLENQWVDTYPLVELARRLPSYCRTDFAFLIAWGNWRGGKGSVAVDLVHWIQERRPDYNAARLLNAALTNGLDPRAVAPLKLPV